MTEKLIGRKYECGELKRCLESDRSELVIVYGRRRIGKTFLVEQYFEDHFDYRYVGVRGLSTKEQLRRFAKVLKAYSGVSAYQFSDWFDAFDAFVNYLETLPTDRKRVIFIDEMPWIDTGRSNFVVALENFWNGWAMSKRNIMLIATGSATSWMRDKLVSNRGGLHARITCQLHIAPEVITTCDKYSEDIDIAIRREGRFSISGTSNTQLAKARRTARHYIVRELPSELEEALHSLGVENFGVTCVKLWIKISGAGKITTFAI